MQTITILSNDDGKVKTIGNEDVSTPLILLKGNGIRGLAALIEHVDSELIHICWEGVVPDDDEWQWDAMALLELFPDSVMIGGIVHDGKKIVDGPRIFGFGCGFDSPDNGRLLLDPGYGAKMWKPHTVSAVSPMHCVIRASFLRQYIRELLEQDVIIEMLGVWLGALALEAKDRVIFSPFMRARVSTSHDDSTSSYAKGHFLSRFWSLIPDQRVYSPRLGLSLDKAYMEVNPAANRQHITKLQSSLLPYVKYLEMALSRRIDSYPTPEKLAQISIITTVYEGTNINLLDELAKSVIGQTLKPAQWIIVVHGPITAEYIDHISKCGEEQWGAMIIIEPKPLGIMGAMHRGLESASGEYIVPADADDLLTPDAIQQLSCAIARFDRPDLIFSDEDLLIEEQPALPYLRSSFDPVLNLDSSYIWHLCAINRDRAISLELYTDAGATWCHDWDSVMRIASAGGRIEHVPEVLYHWRQHTGSTTNNTQADPRSLTSIRHILERQIALSEMPQRYYVSDWPMDRGARELYIARKTSDMPQLIWIGDDLAEFSDCDKSAILVIAGSGVLIDSHEVYVEVARLFELHPHVGAVGGLVVDKNGIIVDGCQMLNSAEMLESPWLGQPASYGGPYGLALKTQTVATTGNLLAFFRVAALQEGNIWPLESHAPSSSLVMQLCGRISEHDWAIAYSPLILARTSSDSQMEFRYEQPPIGVSDKSYALARYGMSRNFQI